MRCARERHSRGEPPPPSSSIQAIRPLPPDPAPVVNSLLVITPGDTLDSAPSAQSEPVLTDVRAPMKEHLAARVGLMTAEADQLIELFPERRFIENVDSLWPRGVLSHRVRTAAHRAISCRGLAGGGGARRRDSGSCWLCPPRASWHRVRSWRNLSTGRRPAPDVLGLRHPSVAAVGRTWRGS